MVDASLRLGFSELVLLVLDRVDKLGFFGLSELLQSHELVLVAVQGLHGGLVDHSGRFVGRMLVDVSQRVVVHSEGAFRPQEDGHVGMVGRADLLAVQGLLDGTNHFSLLAVVGSRGRRLN